MTFDKYKGKFQDKYVFPDDGYEYTREYNKKIGWHNVRGKKLSDLPKQKWSIRIPKKVKK